MTEWRTIPKGEFQAIDGQGKAYGVFAFLKVLVAPIMDAGLRSEDPADFRYHLADGREVQRIGKGQYLIVGTEIQLTSTDLKAL